MIDQGGSLLAAATACGAHRGAALEAARGIARPIVCVLLGACVLGAILAPSGRVRGTYPEILAFERGAMPSGLHLTSVRHAVGGDVTDLDVLIVASLGAACAAACVRRPTLDSLEWSPLVLFDDDWTPPPADPHAVSLTKRQIASIRMDRGWKDPT